MYKEQHKPSSLEIQKEREDDFQRLKRENITNRHQRRAMKKKSKKKQ